MLWVLLLLSLCYGLFQRLLVAHAEHPPVLSTIFLDTTSPTFTITTAGSSGTISYTVTDLSGLLIARGQSGVTNRQTVLTLPPQPDGYYVLQITDHTAEPPANQAIPFAVVTSFAPEADSPFGVGTHFIELFEDGALPYMDVVSDHPYTLLYIASPELEGTEEQMEALQDLVKHYNHGKGWLIAKQSINI